MSSSRYLLIAVLLALQVLFVSQAVAQTADESANAKTAIAEMPKVNRNIKSDSFGRKTNIRAQRQKALRNRGRKQDTRNPNSPPPTAKKIAEPQEQGKLDSTVPASYQQTMDKELILSSEPEIVGTSNDCVSPYSALTSRALVWGRAEYLHWWTRGTDMPALVTTSPDGTPQSEAGVLGLPTTSVLFGDSELADQSRSGGRFTLGVWFNRCCCTGMEVTYTGLENESETFSATNDDFSILARPFFNTQNDADEAHFIAFPGQAAGSLDVDLTTKFDTLEILFRKKVGGSDSSLNYVLGYRTAELEDRLRIDESTQILALPGTTIDLFDQFDVTNNFHGGEFGIATHWQTNRCFTGELTAKVALGNTRSRVDIAGETTTSSVGASANAQGGLLAQSTNIGNFDDDTFSAIAEFGVTVRREFQTGLTATMGYTFLYWSDVARVADQIDLGVNTTQIPPGTLVGEARPAVPFDITSFWAQGLRFGLEYIY